MKKNYILNFIEKAKLDKKYSSKSGFPKSTIFLIKKTTSNFEFMGLNIKIQQSLNFFLFLNTAPKLPQYFSHRAPKE